MSITLRILLLAVALLTAVWILRKIHRFKVRLEGAIYWIIFAVILCILAIFPDLTYWLSSLLGIQSPANLIFLIIISLLMEKIFTLSTVVSQLEEKISVLSAEVALRNHSEERRLKADEADIREIKETINQKSE